MKKYFSSSEEIEQNRQDYLEIRNHPPDSPLPHLETLRAPFFDLDVNAINEIGFTRLWYAVSEDQDATETKRLLEAKANVNLHLRHDGDDNLLTLATKDKASFQCIKLLLDYGARTYRLLHYAIEFQNEDVFSYVLSNQKFESLINSKDGPRGSTPLDYAREFQNIHFAERLMERGGKEELISQKWIRFLKAKIKAVKYSIMVFIAVIKRTVPSTLIPLDMRRLLAQHVWSTRFQEPWYQMGEE